MKRQHKFALVGCGQIGSRHARHIAEHSELAAVCDIDVARGKEFATRFGVPLYANLETLLRAEPGIDVVVICTPNGLHARQSIMALHAGRHVLCEKPMAISSADANAMIQAEKRSGKKLFVVKQNRFNPPVAYARQLLDEGLLGKIHSFSMNCFWNRPASYFKSDWRGTLELDGGTLFTQFSHFIDLLQWFAGDVAAANGTRANFMHRGVIDFEDTGSAILQMSGGAIGSINYTINATRSNMEGSFTLFAEKGTLKIGGQYLNELEYFSVEGLDRPELPSGKPANTYGQYQGSMSNHGIVYDHFIRAIDDDQHELLDSTETMKTVSIIETIYQSSPLLS